MSAIRFPIAANAHAALSAPMGRAARASEAQTVAGEVVAFVTEAVGPAFTTREAALDAFVGRLDDERPGGRSILPEDRYCGLREMSEAPPPLPGKSSPPRPVYRDGRRWPAPAKAPRVVWRLSISYWKTGAAEPLLAPPPSEPGRKARETSADPKALDPKTLRERLARPLVAVKPQQPLDVGLFEFRPPEAPHILMPDE